MKKIQILAVILSITLPVALQASNDAFKPQSDHGSKGGHSGHAH